MPDLCRACDLCWGVRDGICHCCAAGRGLLPGDPDCQSCLGEGCECCVPALTDPWLDDLAVLEERGYPERAA